MKSTEIKSNGDLLMLQQKQIRQSNAITSGRFDFSACQLDILFMLLANFHPEEDTYLIHCKDIELITGRKWNYQQFKDATEEMIRRMFEIEDNETYIQLVLFQYFKYQKGKGTVEIKISALAKELFFDLKKNFTYLQLKSVLSCSSKYAKRIYGLCCQWRAAGHKEYSLQDFKYILGLIDGKTGKEQFKEINAFRIRVLDIAKEQINKYTDIRFDYKLEKKYHSRSFNSTTIYINQPTTEQMRLELEKTDIDFNKSIQEQKDIKYIMAYGLSEEQAKKILSNGSIEDFKNVIDEMKKQLIKNPKQLNNQVAYLCGSLKNKGLL